MLKRGKVAMRRWVVGIMGIGWARGWLKVPNEGRHRIFTGIWIRRHRWP